MDGMRRLPAGSFRMGSNRFYPEERPVRVVDVAPFWIDETPVTNAHFAAFVDATGYRTFAETPPDPADYPGMPPEMARAGSLVFRKADRPVALDDFRQWWRFEFGADWRHPLGSGSSIDGLEDHPVVHVTHHDARAYAAWAGKALPSEAEWEYAAWGGRSGVDYAWGRELAPDGAMLANYWQGLFPFDNRMLDGYEWTSPVRSFPPNDFGLFDMIGNVWEWTDDWYELPGARSRSPARSCCGDRAAARSMAGPAAIGSKVVKGGSHLCAENYCRRYRPAARQPQAIDTSTTHIGFRCVIRE